MKKRRTQQQIREHNDHQVPKTQPKRIPQSLIVSRIAKRLNYDYAEHEVLDVLEAFGPVVLEAMQNYESVRIRGLGEFVFKTQKPKKYYNVANQRFEFTDWSYKPYLELIRAAKRDIQNNVKQLHVETLQQPADYVLPDHEQLRSYQIYLAKLGQWSENKLKKFTADAMKDITELSRPDELEVAKTKIEAYKKNLDARYDRYYADILQKMQDLQDKIEIENEDDRLSVDESKESED